MKKLLLSALILPILSTAVLAQDAAPYALTHHGHFKRMMHMKNTDGVVNVTQATDKPHLYGVGAPAHGTGEITVLDGKLWVDYGGDGLGNAVHSVATDEDAVLLVTAEVESWQDVIVPSDMTKEQMQAYILSAADDAGVDTAKAFPFLIEGAYFDLEWHILNGRKPDGSHGNGGIFKKITEVRAQTSGTVVGFYSADLQGVYTHPNESWHLHVIFADEGKAGHVDEIAIRQGAVLKLPK